MSKKNYSKQTNLPKELIHIKNKEKEWHEKWNKERDPLNFPHPFRMLLLGGVNSGKTNTIKNIMARIEPIFKKIYLLHCGGEWTKEYEEIEHTILHGFEELSNETFDGKEKSLLIIEDMCLQNLNKVEKRKIDRLFGYISTHRNLSIMLTSQNFMSIPPKAREMSNILIIWKVRDTDLLKIIGRRIGLSKEEMISLSRKVFHEYRDSLWIDDTAESPFPLRKNGYIILHKDTFLSFLPKDKQPIL
jgi:hypothetical protein